LLRMKEERVIRIVAENKTFTEHKEKHDNQPRTKSISHSTLMEMLRWH
jgi:hypothetical protein